MVQNSRRETGSTPVVGSSRSSRSGRVDEGAGQGQLLPHAAGQPFGQTPPERGQPGKGQELFAAGPEIAAAVDLGEELDVLVHGQVAVQAEALRQVPDPAQGRSAGGGSVPARERRPDPSSAAGCRTACGSGSSCPPRRDRPGRTSRPRPTRRSTERTAGIPSIVLRQSPCLDRPAAHFVPRAQRIAAPFNTASAGKPGLSSPSGLSISILTAKTSLTRSWRVWTFLGVNSASGEM